MRELILIPVIHDEVEMGSLSQSLKGAYMLRMGPADWERQSCFLEKLWETVRKGLSKKVLDYRHVKLYQDGLPVCGKEAEIVRDVAQQGSLNHKLLLELMEKGAVLMGTEDVGLLLEEYRELQKSLKSSPDGGPQLKGDEKKMQALLRKRDQYISRTIDTTLAEGEVGILFIGLAHKVEKLLPPDIKLSHLKI